VLCFCSGTALGKNNSDQINWSGKGPADLAANTPGELPQNAPRQPVLPRHLSLPERETCTGGEEGQISICQREGSLSAWLTGGQRARGNLADRGKPGPSLKPAVRSRGFDLRNAGGEKGRYRFCAGKDGRPA